MKLSPLGRAVGKEPATQRALTRGSGVVLPTGYPPACRSARTQWSRTYPEGSRSHKSSWIWKQKARGCCWGAGNGRWVEKELTGCWDSRNGLPSDLCHDGALPSKVLKAQAQEAVNHKSCQGKGRHDQQDWWKSWRGLFHLGFLSAQVFPHPTWYCIKIWDAGGGSPVRGAAGQIYLTS